MNATQIRLLVDLAKRVDGLELETAELRAKLRRLAGRCRCAGSCCATTETAPPPPEDAA